MKKLLSMLAIAALIATGRANAGCLEDQLFLGVYASVPNKVQEALDKGANPKAKYIGFTPLVVAVSIQRWSGNAWKVLNILAFKASVDELTEAFKLTISIGKINLSAMRILIRYGAKTGKTISDYLTEEYNFQMRILGDKAKGLVESYKKRYQTALELLK